MSKKFLTLEIIGVAFVYLTASFLHFVYDLTNGSVLAIIFGSVNESVWEHIKIFAVGFVLWAIVEFLWVKPKTKKFVVAKTFSLYLLSLSIIVFFYSYNAVLDGPILWLDLLSSFIFVIVAQYISYRLVTRENSIADYYAVALMLLMLYFLMFFSFTVFPPQIELFKDPVTGMYGIIEQHIDIGAVFMDNL